MRWMACTAWTTPTDGLGTFPGPRRARVLWLGIADPEGRLRRLAGSVREALAPEVPDLDGAAPFRAHVTLARVRDQRGADLSAWIAANRAPSGSVAIDRIGLYRSHLGDGPARYESLGSIRLARTAGAMMGVEAEASAGD